MYIGKWEVNNIIVVPFALILVVVAALFFLVSSVQDKRTTMGEPSNAEGASVSYGFSTVQEMRLWETAVVELFWTNRSIDGRQGIVLLHPVSTTQPRYMENKFNLVAGNKYKLQVASANVAGKAPFANATRCDDSIIALSAKSGENEKRREFVVNSNDGWVLFSIDISEFAGSETVVRVSGVSGGPCGDWNGEWSAVDMVEIVNYK
ncbi:MAG: hypothetical protein HY516_02855 [Candidatus Aenigmarchaeota archaeon]|nr:hypothetical protein [Candidatus Aenigmarchaeota archaeon]